MSISCLFCSYFWPLSCQSQMAHLCFLLVNICFCQICSQLVSALLEIFMYAFTYVLVFFERINADLIRHHCPPSFLDKLPQYWFSSSVKLYMWWCHALRSIFIHLLCSLFSQEAILDIKRIRVSYLRTWFIPDVIAAFPIGYILLFAVILSTLLRQEAANSVLQDLSLHKTINALSLTSFVHDLEMFPLLSFFLLDTYNWGDDPCTLN